MRKSLNDKNVDIALSDVPCYAIFKRWLKPQRNTFNGSDSEIRIQTNLQDRKINDEDNVTAVGEFQRKKEKQERQINMISKGNNEAHRSELKKRNK